MEMAERHDERIHLEDGVADLLGQEQNCTTSGRLKHGTKSRPARLLSLTPRQIADTRQPVMI
jgi:hypothetical protein